MKMPPRRRAAATKAKNKLKTLSSGQLKESSSAEDTDSNSNAATQCREIVKRLAKKYLLKSSTDTTDSSDQKENVNGKGQVTDPYDADLETDGGVTTTSDMECQTDESLMEDSVVLSPSRKANKQNTGRETRRRRGKQQTSASQKTKQKKSPITYQKQKNTSRRKSEQASTGCQTDSEDCDPQSLKKTKVQSLQESDSGMFLSPIGNRPIPKLPRMNASDTSTPSSAIGKSLDDSCFGFDHIASPQGLPFSPVESLSPEDGGVRPGSEMSSLHGSMSSETKSIVSPPKRKYDSVNLTGLIPGDSDNADMPVTKKSRKRKPAVKKNDEEWASKLSAEFDDIDMYELIIE